MRWFRRGRWRAAAPDASRSAAAAHAVESDDDNSASTAAPRPSARQLAVGDQLALAVLLALVAAFIAYFSMSTHVTGPIAKDFTYPWRAARALLAGENPYDVIRAIGAYPYNAAFYYPLPAALVAMPFAPLRPEIAGSIFIGLSTLLLAWAVLRTCPFRWPLFLSAPFVQACVLGQWSPLLTAAALMPALQFLGAAKPTLGIVAWLYRPTWRGAVGAVLLAAVAFVVLPEWLGDWRAAMPSTTKYRGPATTLLGAFLLLGLLRIRRKEGRLFVALSLMPQLPVFYDQLPLWLVPSTKWRSIALSAFSWIGYLAWYPHHALPTQNEVAFPWMLFTLYAPALLLLLSLPVRESAVTHDPIESPVRWGESATKPTQGMPSGG